MDERHHEVNRTASIRREAYRGRLEADPEPEGRKKEGRISEEGKGAEVQTHLRAALRSTISYAPLGALFGGFSFK
jgi:hypothetical protein